MLGPREPALQARVGARYPAPHRFWSGQDFDEAGLAVVGKKFKDASVFYRDTSEIDTKALKRWLRKSRTIQWDYKNTVKRKGKLVRLTTA